MAVPKKRPQLVTLPNGKQVVSSGRWNDFVVGDWLITNGIERFQPISEVAKVGWGHNTIDTKRMARRHISELRRHLLARGHLLITKRAISNTGKQLARIEGIKILRGDLEDERQLADADAERLKKIGDAYADNYEQTFRVLTATIDPSPVSTAEGENNG